MRGWKKGVVVAATLLAMAVVVGLPAMVGLRPFIGPRARPLTDRTFGSTPERLRVATTC